MTEKPAETTTIAYREVLERLYLPDPVPGRVPTRNQLSRAAQAPKHHLADPALAARLLGVDADALLGPLIRSRLPITSLLGRFGKIGP